MENNQPQQINSSANRHYLRVMAFAVGGVFMAAVIGFAVFSVQKSWKPHESVLEVQQQATTTAQFGRSAPTLLRIPALDLEAEFEAPLGLNDDRTIEVPDSYTKVGWYQYGPTPGEVGPAVVLGHVDSYEGPAVFWPLGKLKPGDEVEIAREDGTTAVFVVTHSERYSQNDFPTELVYGPTDDAQLRLITCTGTYLRGIQRYTHNLVVYAVLKGSV